MGGWRWDGDGMNIEYPIFNMGWRWEYSTSKINIMSIAMIIIALL